MSDRGTIDRRHLIATSVAALFAPAVIGRTPAQAQTQNWPNRFVRLVVPFPPGGGTDAIARVMSAKLSEIWGQQVVVENRGGAATNIGTEAVARAEPDGYTILLHSMPLAVNKFLFASLPYDPVADLAPVALICDYPNIMVVPNSSPARSVTEFIAHAKANKGKITFASSGHGTSVHLSGELFKRMAGIEMLHVPYRGAGPAFTDLIPGRVDVYVQQHRRRAADDPGRATARPGGDNGQAHTGGPRPAAIADVGVPGFDVSSWYAFFAPAKTPPEIVRKMNADTNHRPERSRHQAEARDAWRRGAGLDARRTWRLPQSRNGQVGPGDQGRRHFRHGRQLTAGQ